MLNFFSTVIALLCLVGRNSAQQYGTCDYENKLYPGELYSLANREYPSSYQPGSSCRWNVTSDTPIKLTCDHFQLPDSVNCSQTALFIQDASTTKKYCGQLYPLSFISQSNKLIISLVTYFNSTGGRFSCIIEAIPKDAGVRNCSCGWKKRGYSSGGDVTRVNEYPMMAGLVDDVSERMVVCSATIINEKQVLTAAHCVSHRSTANFQVMVGNHDWLGCKTDPTRFYPVDKTRVHPLYKPSHWDYDVALVTIQDTISFIAQIGPVCLPFKHEHNNFDGSYVEILGWRTPKVNYLTNPLRRTRGFVDVSSGLKYEEPTNELNIRIKSTTECQLNSGSPVLWQNPASGRVVLIGMYSFGFICGSTLVETIPVASFLDWILENTPPGVNYCRPE